MGRRAKAVIGAIAAATLTAVAAIGIARVAFERRIAGEVAALFAASRDAEPSVVTEADLAGLPEPVQRWLRWAGVVGRPYPATVRLEQEGHFRLGADRGWMPFTAEEYYTTDPPAFVWTAEMRMFPLVSIVGRDRYADGEGSIRMRLLGLVPVADAAGPRLDQGALLRYLNEAMWFPAGALAPYIAWEAVDANSARATMSYGGQSAAATWFFDAEGRPVDMRAERYDMGSGALQTWSTPISAYGEFGGVRIPTEGEGIWKYPTGDFSYIQLRITAVEYNHPAPF